jgi:hypothetical protein
MEFSQKKIVSISLFANNFRDFKYQHSNPICEQFLYCCKFIVSRFVEYKLEISVVFLMQMFSSGSGIFLLKRNVEYQAGDFQGNKGLIEFEILENMLQINF